MKGINVRLRNKLRLRWSGGLLMCGAVLSSAALLLTAAPGTAFAAVRPTAPAVGSAAVAQTPNAASLPAVTPGEVKAVQAMLPRCGCPPNAGEVEYALKQLGVKSLSLKLLVKRLGKTAGNDAFAALVLSLNKKAATVKRRIPFPDYRSKSATTYAKSPYRVYEIYGTSLGPGFYHETWKYGITRQLIPAERPERQLGTCTRYYGSRFLLGGACTYKWLWIGVGWLQARTIEASYTLLYAITHQGNCPPGMPACI
jgi:hypothetical protein